MSWVKYQSRTRENTRDGMVVTVAYQGTRDEMEALAADHTIGSLDPESGCVLRSSVISQADGSVWQCEFRYDSPDSSGSLGGTAPPDTAVGKKSAQLRGCMLALPLSTHPRYRTEWDHYLWGVADSANASLAIPSMAHSATTDRHFVQDAKTYAWTKDAQPPAEEPEAGLWVRINEPTKPGVDMYEIATYTVTESARFGSAAAAGKMAANKLNSIGAPDQTFGISGGNWKCDDVSVQWSGTYWIATLTWTRSGDGQGWDPDLYD